jgi:hypothetical protein
VVVRDTTAKAFHCWEKEGRKGGKKESRNEPRKKGEAREGGKNEVTVRKGEENEGEGGQCAGGVLPKEHRCCGTSREQHSFDGLPTS